MAKAKKLKSGNWRCLAYSHTEKVYDEKTGKVKEKRIYKSFTSDDPSARGRKEAELAAARFQTERSRRTASKKADYGNMTLYEGINKYIESREMLGRSPTTIHEYRCMQKYGFKDLMDFKLKDIDEIILQEAVNMEACRPPLRRGKGKDTISAKRLRNEWGLVSAVIRKYNRDINLSVIELPEAEKRVVELPSAQLVLDIIKGTDIELPVLLAAWLSFSMSEVRGLTKSKSINGDYITIKEVVVVVGGKDIRKEKAKTQKRNRTLKIPKYIKELIDKVPGDNLVELSGNALYKRWIRLQDENGMEHITFHDLRHLNASIMALLRVPDVYARDRGGWSSDRVMKSVYMQTFSEERDRFDDVIDEYFEELMQHDMQHKK